MKRGLFLSFGLAAALLAIALLGSGCGINPQMTYQGRLTDASGNPLNGTYKLTLRVYNADTGGDLLYTDSDTVNVTDGLFDTVVGPSSVVAGLGPEDLAQPLWLEVQVSDGAITETLDPRQRLYGSPYAFTLMPGAYISQSMDSTVYGGGGATAVLNVVNSYEGTGSNPALPALRVSGDRGIELTGGRGTLYSGSGDSSSYLDFVSNDDVWVDLDEDDDEAASFDIWDGADFWLFSVDENGDMSAAGAKSSVAEINGEERSFYAMESPGVWFEDFGTAALKRGAATVAIDSQFAQAVNLKEDYHVFLTPLGDCSGLYVAEKTTTDFTVRELDGGTSDIEFDYRIIAKRAGYEDRRLEPVNLERGGRD